MEGPAGRPRSIAAEKWSSGEERSLGRDYFQFQYDFAKEIAERTGLPFLDAVRYYTTFLRANVFWHAEDGTEIGLKEGVTEENMVEFAYKEELANDERRKGESMPYASLHPEGSRFGCFRYDYIPKDHSIVAHFFNSEFDEVGPLNGGKLEQRRQEFKDMLADIQQQHPDAKTIRGTSWLLSLPLFLRLFPTTSSLKPEIDRDPTLWRKGTIWGQFMDGTYKLRAPLVKRFLERSRELPLRDLVLALPLPPRKIEVPLAELYREFGIESNPSSESIAAS